MNNKAYAHQEHENIKQKIDGCPICGSHIRTEIVTEEMDYATPKGPVNILVNTPYIICDECGFSGFGEAGERAQTEVIYRYHGRLTPWEIVAIRSNLGLSQVEFAKRLGVGHASLERWETGETMQNQSMDNLVILLSTAANKDWLDSERERRLRASVAQTDLVVLDQFRALSKKDETELRAKSDRFRLRR